MIGGGCARLDGAEACADKLEEGMVLASMLVMSGLEGRCAGGTKSGGECTSAVLSLLVDVKTSRGRRGAMPPYCDVQRM